MCVTEAGASGPRRSFGARGVERAASYSPIKWGSAWLFVARTAALMKTKPIWFFFHTILKNNFL